MRWFRWLDSKCTWIWANSRRYWRTEKPGVLKSTESQRLKHNLATEQQQLYRKYFKTWNLTSHLIYQYFCYLWLNTSRLQNKEIRLVEWVGLAHLEFWSWQNQRSLNPFPATITISWPCRNDKGVGIFCSSERAKKLLLCFSPYMWASQCAWILFWVLLKKTADSHLQT